MDKFISLNYYFSPNPGPSFKYGMVLMVFAALLIVAGYVIKIYRQKTNDKILRKIIKPYSAKLIWFGVVAALMVLLRWEAVTLLSMRFFWIIYFGLLIYSLVNNIKKFYRDYPRKLKQSLSHQTENKYIPTKKKRKK